MYGFIFWGWGGGGGGMHFCPETMTPTQSQLIEIYSVDWTDVYGTPSIEHRTDPVSYKYQWTTNTTATLVIMEFFANSNPN